MDESMLIVIDSCEDRQKILEFLENEKVTFTEYVYNGYLEEIMTPVVEGFAVARIEESVDDEDITEEDGDMFKYEIREDSTWIAEAVCTEEFMNIIEKAVNKVIDPHLEEIKENPELFRSMFWIDHMDDDYEYVPFDDEEDEEE